jgi:hypothetical protein
MVKPVENPIDRIGNRTGDLQAQCLNQMRYRVPPSALLVEEFMICYSESM